MMTASSIIQASRLSYAVRNSTWFAIFNIYTYISVIANKLILDMILQYKRLTFIARLVITESITNGLNLRF